MFGRSPQTRLAALVGLVLTVATACGGSAPAGSSRSPSPPAAHSPSTSPSAPHPTSAATSSHGLSAASAGPARTSLHGWQHLVVVVEENHSYADVVGSSHAPYLSALARSGVLFTASYAITHPSEPNYLGLFSGSAHGLRDDSCPHTYRTASLGAQLRASGRSFTGFSEGLPRTGDGACNAGAYARRHVPWADFTALPRSTNRPFTDWPTDYTKLPALAFVIPDLDHDMHDGTVAQGDSWLRGHLDRYVRWARTHDSALLITWDEDDRSASNHIPTIVVGAHVPARHYTGHVDHYTMLRTIEWSFGLPGIGLAARRRPVTAISTG